MSNQTTADYPTLAREVRKKVLTMIHKAHTSHIASNFSVIDIATVLYENLKENDLVVWSKGWSAATIYYFLWREGKIPKKDLDKFPNPPYLGLAEPEVNGVLVAGGAMGHGLPVAVGIALGKKRAREIGVTYCIMSDGEMNEGTTWESAAVASHHQLNNLVVFVDKNKWQAMGKTEEVLDINIKNVFSGFDWNVITLDGHNYQSLEKAIKLDFDKIVTRWNASLPTVIICETIKGKGVSFFEDHLLYHYKHVDEEDYKKAMVELG